MRTKGKLTVENYPRASWLIGQGWTIAELHQSKREEDAAHLAACWNAFEPGGVVEEMREALIMAVIVLKSLDKLRHVADKFPALDRAKAVLAKLGAG